MKKKYLIVFAVLAFNLSMSQNNKGFVIYKKENLRDFTSTEKANRLKEINPKVFQQTKKIEIHSNELLKDINFKLSFNKNMSIFKVEKFLEVENNMYFKFAVGPDGASIYYTNLTLSENYRQTDAFGQKFLIKNSKIVWKLSKDQKKIGKHLCYKATTVKITNGRNGIIKTPITVWYASEIPLSFGPLGYSGLPGLILELEIKNSKFYADKIILNSKDAITIKKPTKGKVVTKEEFDEIGLKLMKNYKRF